MLFAAELAVAADEVVAGAEGAGGVGVGVNAFISGGLGAGFLTTSGFLTGFGFTTGFGFIGSFLAGGGNAGAFKAGLDFCSRATSIITMLSLGGTVGFLDRYQAKSPCKTSTVAKTRPAICRDFFCCARGLKLTLSE